MRICSCNHVQAQKDDSDNGPDEEAWGGEGHEESEPRHRGRIAEADEEETLKIKTSHLVPRATTAEYVAEVKDINQNIKAMFEKQAEDARVPWDQEHFEDLVAKWVAACDQPFTAVITDEFREMLEYTHHHSPKPLNIPSDESVKKRITRMSQEMVDGLKQIFKIPGVLTLAITTEESLIDFRELIGQHSGENMAAAIWETVEMSGLLGRTMQGKRFEVLNMPHTIHLSALKLLEAIGVLTKEEKVAVKSNSRGAVYQEAATESLRRAADDDAGETDDGADFDKESPESVIGRAVFKVRTSNRKVTRARNEASASSGP
ncbi:hypothetical protein B0H14DRAFT_3136986 [Mycena olivaceomarginata]|nr:hypothetical protein B0H14DRAFT_3136986 [Mycena olivaceomarginata]